MSRPSVYVTRKLPAAAMEIIAAACDYEIWDHEEPPVPRDEMIKKLGSVDGALVLLTDKIDEEVLAAAPNLKVVANMAVGYDNINVPDCTKHGVMVTNTPGVLTETTADLTWALLMATARRIVESQKVVERGDWKTWSPMMLTGQDIFGKTIGVIGAGRIGAAVLRRAKGFGMTMLYHNRSRNAEMEAETGAAYVSMDDLLARADYVVTLVPLTPETRHLINEEALRKMKPNAVFVNAARGPVVDEKALYKALTEGWIWAAGLDVWEVEPIGADHPLLTLPNVVALPHIGSASIDTRTRMAVMAAQNLVAAVTGQKPPNLVNP